MRQMAVIQYLVQLPLRAAVTALITTALVKMLAVEARAAAHLELTLRQTLGVRQVLELLDKVMLVVVMLMALEQALEAVVQVQ